MAPLDRRTPRLAAGYALGVAVELHRPTTERHVHGAPFHEVDELARLGAGDDLAADRRPFVHLRGNDRARPDPPFDGQAPPPRPHCPRPPTPPPPAFPPPPTHAA